MTESSKATSRLSRSDRRAQLLAAAKGAFVNHGYHAAAMDDIADRAGVSKPVLYQHFPSKLELYLALLAESADELVRLVEVALHGSVHNDERVHRAVEAYFSFVADNGQAYRLIFESDLRGERQVEDIVDRAADACIRAITQTIITDTAVDPSGARLLAAALVGLSQVGARHWLAEKDPVPRAEAIDMVATLAWRGLSRFPASDGRGRQPIAEKPTRRTSAGAISI